MSDEARVSPQKAACTVCRGSGVCTYCNGDGYTVENERLLPCGVCETSGTCPICKTPD